MGAVPSRISVKQTWIRLVGLPFHLWSPNVFKALGDYCGGWIKTEEETELRNLLKWARLLIIGDDSLTLKEVMVEFEGTKYVILIWNETLVRFSVEEEEGLALDPWILKDKPALLNGYPSLSESIGHVVPSKIFENLSHPRAHPCVGTDGTKNKVCKKVFGVQNILDSGAYSRPITKGKLDILIEEVQAIHLTFEQKKTQAGVFVIPVTDTMLVTEGEVHM